MHKEMNIHFIFKCSDHVHSHEIKSSCFMEQVSSCLDDMTRQSATYFILVITPVIALIMEMLHCFSGIGN